MMKYSALLLATGVALLAGCASWPPNHRYGPNPLEVRLQPAGADDLAAALFAVQGFVESEDGAELRIRMRLVNFANFPLTTNTADWQLVTADLDPFGTPSFSPDPLVIESEKEAVAELSFPLPPEWEDQSVDLSALNLSFALEGDGKVYRASAAFERTRRARYRAGFGAYPVWFGHPYYYQGFFFHPGQVR